MKWLEWWKDNAAHGWHPAESKQQWTWFIKFNECVELLFTNFCFVYIIQFFSRVGRNPLVNLRIKLRCLDAIHTAAWNLCLHPLGAHTDSLKRLLQYSYISVSILSTASHVRNSRSSLPSCSTKRPVSSSERRHRNHQNSKFETNAKPANLQRTRALRNFRFHR